MEWIILKNSYPLGATLIRTKVQVYKNTDENLSTKKIK
jgi:hypothetical protein